MKHKLFAIASTVLLLAAPATAAGNKKTAIGQIPPPPPDTGFEIPPPATAPELSSPVAAPNRASANFTVATSKPCRASSTGVQYFVDYINLQPGQNKLPLRLTFNNAGFNYISCSIAGHAVLRRKNITGQGTFSVDMTGNMSDGSSQVLINAVGAKDATLSWELTTPKSTLRVVKPYEVSPGDTISLEGSNFSSDTKNTKVRVDNKDVELISATSYILKAKLPDDMERGKHMVSVAVCGQKAGELEIVVKSQPEVDGVSLHSAPPGQEITITGKHFAKNSADNKVMIGPAEAEVLSGDTTSLNVIIPDSLDLNMNPAYGLPITVQVGKAKSKGNVTIDIQTRVF